MLPTEHVSPAKRVAKDPAAYIEVEPLRHRPASSAHDPPFVSVLSFDDECACASARPYRFWKS
jgi:hypothetical protein